MKHHRGAAKMKTAALAFGVIGGLIASVYGLAGFALAGLTGTDGGLFKLACVVLPVASLFGVGLLQTKPAGAAALMLISAVGLFALFGGGLALIPAIFLGLGALLRFAGMQEEAGDVSR